MKIVLFSLFISFSGAALADQVAFSCSDAKEARWTQYHCVSGALEANGNLTSVTFGICEGSKGAGEEEPVQTVEIKAAQPGSGASATSVQWRNAAAYDLTTPELGAATLYLNYPNTTARLKVGGQDLRLECGF